MSNETGEIVTEEKHATKSHTGSGKAGIFFSLLAMVISVGGIGYGYVQFTKLASFAQMNVSLRDQSANTQNIIHSLQQSVDELKKSAQNSQALTAKQEQMIADWQASQKGDLNRWYVAEAQYLVKLANDHLQFTHDTIMVMTLLQRADDVLGNLQDPNLMELRKSIAADIASLQASPNVDVTQVYLRLTALNNQIDQLPLPLNPIKDNLPAVSQHANEAGLPWWKIGLNRSWEALQKIVIVRYNNSNSLPLVMPEEKAFLYQNLHAQISEAIWGLLHRNNDVYQSSLAQASAWIQKYYAQDAVVTKAMLQSIQELQKISFQLPSVNIAVTMQLFDSFFTQAGQVKAVQ